MIFTTPNLNNY